MSKCWDIISNLQHVSFFPGKPTCALTLYLGTPPPPSDTHIRKRRRRRKKKKSAAASSSRQPFKIQFHVLTSKYGIGSGVRFFKNYFLEKLATRPQIMSGYFCKETTLVSTFIFFWGGDMCLSNFGFGRTCMHFPYLHAVPRKSSSSHAKNEYGTPFLLSSPQRRRRRRRRQRMQTKNLKF